MKLDHTQTPVLCRDSFASLVKSFQCNCRKNMDNLTWDVNNSVKQSVLSTDFAVAGEKMRLICPNCGAQYEVDARVIPDTGRDVQCSNCGHTWFQQPAHKDNDLAEELGYEVPEEATQQGDFGATPDAPGPETPHFDTEPEPDIEAEPSPEAEPKAAPAPEITPEPDVKAEADIDDGADDTDAADEDTPIDEARRSSVLKDSVRDILRAEVEFDQTMRRPESDPLESQPDLGLEEPSQDAAKKSLRDRMARLRGLDPADSGIIAGSAAAVTGKRRDLLPDIEEINSTLSAASDRDDDGTVPDEDTRRARAERSSFRTGFGLLVLLTVVLVGLYLFAPLIAQKVPSLAGVMDAYVTVANGFRAWMDRAMSAASARLNALLSQLNS
ncbi:zinc-ribbon domain-containing protein [Celeribacter baekdonensis]|uniref:zinc-ribbon domain-containing protein n=1 Tax=Celeribacter baekdonensis TaxID=875171 RepID=UPI003A8EBF13